MGRDFLARWVAGPVMEMFYDRAYEEAALEPVNDPMINVDRMINVSDVTYIDGRHKLIFSSTLAIFASLRPSGDILRQPIQPEVAAHVQLRFSYQVDNLGVLCTCLAIPRHET